MRIGLLARAEAFLASNARLLERRIFSHVLRGGPKQAVLDALRAYQNGDGGFGGALEADVLAEESQPIHVEYALFRLAEVDAQDVSMATRACEFLARTADPSGGVPAILQSALDSPHAVHWNSPSSLEPSIERTIGLAGLLHRQGVDHPWLEQVTAICWKRLEEPLGEAHLLLGALQFLEHAPDRERADALYDSVARQVPAAQWFRLETPVTSYGLTPLHFAPTPDARCRSVFAGDVIEAHLADLSQQQQEDGGWPIYWEPPGPAALSAWRSRWTLDAISALHAWGRLEG